MYQALRDAEAAEDRRRVVNTAVKGSLAAAIAGGRRVRSVGGPELARLMPIMQLPVAPSQVVKTGSHAKESSANRRAEKIRRGLLKVTADGKLVGA